MRRPRHLFPVLAGLLLAGVPGVGLALDARTFAREVDALIARTIPPDGPGAAVLVTEGEEVLCLSCRGMADLEHAVPVTPETRFELASASKQFTALAVLMLEQAERLELTDDIRRYFPELPEFAGAITIRHLLHHTSGLWDFWSILPYTGFHPRDYLELRQVLTLIGNQPAPLFAPGERYAYCNTNYALLAELVARVTGRTFDDWMDENVFTPLDMHDTHVYSDCTRLVPDRAVGYVPEAGHYMLGRPANVAIGGQAHVFATIADLAKWLPNFGHARTGGRAVIDRMIEKGRLNDGSRIGFAGGLVISQRRGTLVAGHSGQTGGYRTHLLYCPDLGIGIAVLANARDIDATAVAYAVLDLCRGPGSTGEQEDDDEAAAPRAAAGVAAAQVEPAAYSVFAGGYRVEGSGEILAAFVAGNRLVAALWGVGMDGLQPTSSTSFTNQQGNLAVTFTTGPAGEAVAMRAVFEGREMLAERIAVDTRAETLARDFSGAYYSRALGTTYELAMSAGQLSLSHPRRGSEPLQMVSPDRCVGSIGFLTFRRDGQGRVEGFDLTGEDFGFGDVPFQRCGP